jgi:hypothetical protein
VKEVSLFVGTAQSQHAIPDERSESDRAKPIFRPSQAGDMESKKHPLITNQNRTSDQQSH